MVEPSFWGSVGLPCFKMLHIHRPLPSESSSPTRSTAFRRPWVFCDQRCIMGDSWCARASRILFDVIFKAVNPLFWCIFSKTCILPRRNYHFWGFWEFPNEFDLTCFDVVFKAVNPLFWCIFSKTSISPRRNYHFWICENSQPEMSWFLCWSQQRFGFFQEPLRIWIVEGTMPAPHEQMESSRELTIAWHDTWVESSRELTVT